MTESLKKKTTEIMMLAHLQCLQLAEYEPGNLDFEQFREHQLKNITGLFLMNAEAGFATEPEEVRRAVVNRSLDMFHELVRQTFNAITESNRG